MTNEKLKEAYLFIFDNFAADTSEVAEEIEMSVSATFNLLETCNLIVGELIVNGISGNGITRKNFPGKPYTWQCWETHDSINREEAIALFDEEYKE